MEPSTQRRMATHKASYDRKSLALHDNVQIAEYFMKIHLGLMMARTGSLARTTRRQEEKAKSQGEEGSRPSVKCEMSLYQL